MFTIQHTHRTSYERHEDGAAESAEVAIHLDVQPGSAPDLEIVGVEVLCAPGTGIGRHRVAPPHIRSWAESYCLDHATEILAEASGTRTALLAIGIERHAA